MLLFLTLLPGAFLTFLLFFIEYEGKYLSFPVRMLTQSLRVGRLAAQRTLLPAVSTFAPVSVPHRLFHASPRALEAFDYKEWTSKFLTQVSNVPAATDPAQSSEALRDLVRSKLLKFTE